jgi:hypothetical protein
MAVDSKSMYDQFRVAEFIAEVLKNTSLLEDDLDFTLALYFCGPGRHFTFMETVGLQMQFNTKIRILENIQTRKNLKSRIQAITGLRRFQRIRNLVAHPILIRPSKIQSLCDDIETRGMILNFPAAMNEEFRKVRRSLYHLTRSREWKPNLTTRIPGKFDRLLDRFNKSSFLR